MIYHVYQLITIKSRGEAFFDWSKCNYVIGYKDEEAADADLVYEFSCIKFMWMLSRGIVIFGIQMSIAGTLYYASEAAVNPGVVLTILTSNLIMIALYFYFVYGQNLSIQDLIGGLFIIACTLMIALSN